MSKERFLLWMLAGIFSFQAVIFAYGFTACMEQGGRPSCPEIGKRYEQTFNLMIATVLGLLTGSALKE